MADESFREAVGRLDDPAGGTLASSGRLLLARVREGVASLVLDAAGLTAGDRLALERRLRAANVAMPGIADLRVAWSEERRQRTVIAVASGKGGVGKSTLAANLAIALARLGRQVGLVDADIYGPSQTRIMGESRRPELLDKQIVPVTAHGVKMLSIGQLVEPGRAVAWRGPMTAGALGNLMEGAWGDTDLMVVDLPPGTGDVQMSLIQKWKPAGAVIVSTPQDLALIDATRAIDLFRKMDVPLLGLVENMAGYQCPHCGETSDPFGQGGAEAAARVLGLPFLGRVPLTLHIREASDAGRPPAAEDGYEGRILRAIAAKLLERIAP